ncbi:MAG: hypothetical protein Q9213_006165 [Squamulea squamosa]
MNRQVRMAYANLERTDRAIHVDRDLFSELSDGKTGKNYASSALDGSQRRRGFPTAHQVFGPAQAINSANYAYFLAQQELLALPNWPEAIRIFNEELLNLHRGQGMDVFWRDTMTVPTEGQYLDMVSKKTGGLFTLAARLLQSLSPTSLDVLPLTNLLGLMYQICDDYKNLSSDQVSDKCQCHPQNESMD